MLCQTFDEPKYLQTAVQAAEFVLKHQVTGTGRLLRTYGAAPGQAPKAAVNGYLEDYAALVHGLLTLHEVTKEKKWLDTARTLTNTCPGPGFGSGRSDTARASMPKASRIS